MIKPVLELGNGKWGARDGSLLAYTQGDTIDKFIRRHFKFERGTNLGATRTNKDGLIEKGRENLLDYSNSFDKWADTSGATSAYNLSSGHAGYDGSNDAWLIEKTADNNSYLYFINNTVNTGSNNLVWCYSIYAKAADGDSGVHIYVGDSSTKGFLRVNLNDGSMTAKDGTNTKGYKVEGVTGKAGDKNRWWRISFFSTANVNDKPRLQPRNANGDGQSGGKIYVMNAQFEYGTAPSEYIRTESRKNLLKNSEHIYDWGSSATITKNILGYDGSLDAIKVDKTAKYGRITTRVDAGVTTNTWTGKAKGTLTFSAYAKKDSLDGLHMRVDYESDGSDHDTTNFDLGNAKPAGTQAGWMDSRKAEDVGNGWVRCSVTFTTTKPVYDIDLYPNRIRDDLQATFDDNTTGSIFIQHVQLEQGSQATAYEGTSSYAGLLEDMPRIDYADTDPHFLVEPQTQNLHPHSEYRIAAGFYNSDETYGFKSPDGSNNAIKVQADSSNESHFVVNGMVSVTSDEEYTASVFVKAGNNISDVKFGIADQQATTNFAYAYFDITGDGTVGVTHEGGTGSLVSKTIKKVGTDGWYRVSVTATITDTSIKSVLFMSDDGADPIRFLDSTANMYVYGWQLEEGDYATTYIPTYGVAVTREEDEASIARLDEETITTGLTSCTLLLEFEKPATGEDVDSFRFHGSSTNGRAYVYNKGYGFATNWNDNGNFGLDTNKKVIWRLDSLTGGTLFADGVKDTTPLTGQTSWGDFRNIEFGKQGNGGNLKVKHLALYSEALSDDDCITLTS